MEGARFDGAGWTRGSANVYVGPIPGRLSVAVYRTQGNAAEVLAYCKDTASAIALRDALDALILGAGKDRA